jgi:hypothetical protein
MYMNFYAFRDVRCKSIESEESALWRIDCLVFLVSLLQVRYPVLLTPVEKQMAREVCVAFGQAVSARFFLSFNATSLFSLSLLGKKKIAIIFLSIHATSDCMTTTEKF